jgi:hypothetical protein
MDLPPPRHRSRARADRGRPIKPANEKAHSLQKKHFDLFGFVRFGIIHSVPVGSAASDAHQKLEIKN